MWLPEDRDAAIVWQNEQSLKCPNCGRWDWETADNDEAFHADHETCATCRMVDEHRDRVLKSPGTHWGTRIVLVRGPKPEGR